MKTINTVFAIIIGAFFASVNAQEIETIATFEVLDGRDNGSDITPQMLEANAFLVLYISSDKKGVALIMKSNVRAILIFTATDVIATPFF